MSKPASITAILVGGRETRHLRVPKQSLPFGDTTVLGKTLNAYLEAGVSEVVLVLGYKADQVEADLGSVPSKVRIVKNPLFDEGMASFLRTGIRELDPSAGGFCVGLGDQPLLTPELVEEFLKAFVDGKGKILVPAYQTSIGLPAFFSSDLSEEIMNLPPNGELWDVLKNHQDDLIDHPTGYSAVVRSIDDLDDYHSMLTLAGLEIPELPEATHTVAQPDEEPAPESPLEPEEEQVKPEETVEAPEEPAQDTPEEETEEPENQTST